MLRQAIQGISDLILVPGLINLDFADVKTIMSGMGLAMMGTGVAEGEDRAIEAARRAISSPLLEGASVNGARGVIINVTGGPDLSLLEVSEASTIVQEAADEDANIIFGAVVDPTLNGQGEDHGHRHRLRTAAGTCRSLTRRRRRPSTCRCTPTRAGARRAGGAAGQPMRCRLSADRRSGGRATASSSCRSCRGDRATARGGGAATTWATTCRSATSTCSSAFDVPAFLRRQEG